MCRYYMLLNQATPKTAEGVLFGPARKTLVLSTDDIKAAYADGEVQPIAGTFPKHFTQKRWDKETIIKVYDRMLPLS